MLLRGKTVYLRAIEPEDLDLFYEVENDTTLWECSATNVPYSRFALKNFIASATNDIYTDKQMRLVVCRISDDIPVAIADLMNFDPHHLRAEVGIMVLAPYRNCGIATETLSTLDVYARHTLLIHTLYAIAAEGNVASQKLFEKAGYTCVATLPDWLATERGYLNAMLLAKTIEKQC